MPSTDLFDQPKSLEVASEDQEGFIMYRSYNLITCNIKAQTVIKMDEAIHEIAVLGAIRNDVGE